MENFEKYTILIHFVNGGLKTPSLPLQQTSKQGKVLRCVTPIIAPLATTLNPVVEPTKIYRELGKFIKGTQLHFFTLLHRQTPARRCHSDSGQKGQPQRSAMSGTGLVWDVTSNSQNVQYVLLCHSSLRCNRLSNGTVARDSEHQAGSASPGVSTMAAPAGSLLGMRSRPYADASCMLASARQSPGRGENRLGSAQHLCSSSIYGAEGGTWKTVDSERSFFFKCFEERSE